MNLVPLLFALLLWLALWRLSRREFPEGQILFFVLLALNYPFGSYSRINDQIMPMTFFAVAGLIFFVRAWDRRPKLFFPAAVLFGCSFLSKGKIIYFLLVVLPLAFLLIVLERREAREFRLNAVRLAWFAGGALLVAVPWFFLIYSRYPAVFRNVGGINAEHMLPDSFGQALSFWILKPPFSFYPSNLALSFILFFALAALLGFVFSRGGRTRIGPLEIVCAVWAVAGLGLHAFIGYRPVRHYIEFTIPILILVSIFLARLRRGSSLPQRVRRNGWVLGGLFILFLSAVSSIGRRFLYVNPLSDLDQAKVRLFFLSLLAALALSIAVFIILSRKGGAASFVVPRTVAGAVIVAALAIYGVQNIAKHVEWLRQPSWNLRTIGRDVGAAFPEGVFSGLLVPSLSLENRTVAHTSWPHYANDAPDFPERAGLTHLFLGTYNNEPAYYDSAFPEAAKKARLVAQYRMWRSWFLLYDLRPALPPPAGTTVFEAEAMVRDPGLPGMPRFDADAGGKFALRVEAVEPALIGREQMENTAPGAFRGRLAVKLERAAQSAVIIQMRFLHEGLIAIERRFVLAGGSEPDRAYREIPFAGEFMDDGPYTVEIRSSGAGAFWLDRLEIIQ